MGRRDRGGWDDYETERRMEEIEDNRRYGDDTLLYVIIGIVVVVGAAIWGTGWIDDAFGWHTQEWLKGLLKMS